MTRLSDSIKLAAEVHDGQVDKGGEPYILHPLRVMIQVHKIRLVIKKLSDPESLLCSAVLHDVIEDHQEGQKEGEKQVRKVAGDVTLRTVVTLTRKPGQTWKKYISEIEGHRAPRIIKLIDLADNMDLTRLKSVTKEDEDRCTKYEDAYVKLLSKEK